MRIGQIVVHQLSKRISVLVFRSTAEMAATFLRFQEYYENPRFSGSVFSLAEFKRWYKHRFGAFTYYDDWVGFNIPGWVFSPFLRGRFDPLASREKRLLSIFRSKRLPFYVIALSQDQPIEQLKAILKHELCHALFYTNPRYRQRVVAELRRNKLVQLRKEIRSLGGYSENVLEDELQAAIIANPDELKARIPRTLQKQLQGYYALAVGRLGKPTKVTVR